MMGGSWMGSQAHGIYIVGGILDEVGFGIDRGGIFMSEAAFRDLMSLPTGAHRITVGPVAGETVEQTAVAPSSPWRRSPSARSWRSSSPVLATRRTAG